MVNTFLPYSDFKKIARVLDNKRLGKQRVEAKQILDIITGEAKYTAWRNHPVVVQWKGHATALKAYINAMIEEWIRRGFKNNMTIYKIPSDWEMPWFVKCKAINFSHQASLLRKYPEYYKKFFVVPTKYMLYSYIWAGGLTVEQIKELCTKPDIHKFARLIKK